MNDIVDHMVNIMNTHLVSIENIMSTTTYNRGIHQLIESKDPIEIYRLTREVDIYATQVRNKKKEIHKIIVFGHNGMQYNVGYDLDTVTQLKRVNQKLDKGTHVQYLGTVKVDKKHYFVFGNSIYSLDKKLKKLGNLLVLVEDSIFRKELASENGDFYIIDSRGSIVSSVDQERIGTSIPNEEITVSRNKWLIEDMDLQLVGLHTSDNINIGISRTWSLYRIIIAMMLLMVIITYLFFTKYAVRPLNSINRFISDISQGDLRNLKKRIQASGPREIRSIGREINELLDEVNLLTKRLVTTTTNLYDVELSKKKAELSYLKS